MKIHKNSLKNYYNFNTEEIFVENGKYLQSNLYHEYRHYKQHMFLRKNICLLPFEIEYHGDHHGYVFQGVEMRPALDGEIAEHIKKVSAKETKQARLAELYQQIKEIENEE